MSGNTRISLLLILSAALMAANTAASAVDSGSAKFRQTCEAQLGGLEEESRAAVAGFLDRAEAALSRSNAEAAEIALGDAARATMGVAGFSGSMSVKCLGEADYRRYFGIRYRLHSLEADLDPGNIGAVLQTALFNAAFGRSVDPLDAIPVDAGSYRSAMSTLDENVRLIDHYREAGAFVLPIEQKIADLSRGLRDEVAAEAVRQAGATLAREETAFQRPPTRQAQEMKQRLGNSSELVAAMSGVEFDAGVQEQLVVARRQARESLELLNDARAWELKPGGWPADQARPSAQRAERRGDALLSRGGDSSLDIGLRDELYRLAGKYFEWCDCDGKLAKADAAREQILPMLQAREQRREQQAGQREAELRRQAEEMKRSAEGMQKSEAERQRFRDEADALEEELGF